MAAKLAGKGVSEYGYNPDGTEMSKTQYERDKEYLD